MTNPRRAAPQIQRNKDLDLGDYKVVGPRCRPTEFHSQT